jgi:hypothetical protein
VNKLQRAGAGIAVVLLFATAMWIKDQEIGLRASTTDPVGPSGAVGETVGNGLFRLKVERYESVRSVKNTSSLSAGQAIRTDNVFLVVHARIWSDREPLSPSKPRLVTEDGLAYLQSSRVSGLGDLFPVYQPKMWYPIALTFELPKDRLEGARLVVDNTKIINLLPAKIEVDLGIDKAIADRLRARPLDSYEIKAG